MSTESKLQNARVLDAEHRARKYRSVDGLPQILGGAALALYGASVWYFFTWSIWNFVVGTALLLALIAISLRGEKTLEWLKGRVTYPRTGYAPFPPPPPPEYDGFFPPDPITELHINTPNRDTPPDIRRAWLSWLGTTALACSFPTVCVLLWDIRTPWICFVAALLIDGLFWFVAYREKSFPWIMLFGLPFIGLAMSVLSVERNYRLAELMIGLGILAIFDGAVTLIRYLRRNPVAHG